MTCTDAGNPVGVWETVIFPVNSFPTSNTPFSFVGNRAVITPGSVIRSITAAIPAAATSLDVTVSANDIVEPVCGVQVFATITGPDGNFVTQSEMVPIYNGYTAIANVPLFNTPYLINPPAVGKQTATVHVTARFVLSRLFTV